MDLGILAGGLVDEPPLEHHDDPVGQLEQLVEVLGQEQDRGARVRALATLAGGALAGVGGSYLSLYYPGTWNEGLSSGQGLMAIALVIFARWRPGACVWVALLFGAATALGPALQSVGITAHYYLFNAAPYALTLGLLIASSSPRRALAGAPSEVSISR